MIIEKEGPKSNWTKLKNATKRARRSPPPVRRLRLRGDWSDTGPDARPERDTANTVSKYFFTNEFRTTGSKNLKFYRYWSGSPSAPSYLDGTND